MSKKKTIKFQQLPVFLTDRGLSQTLLCSSFFNLYMNALLQVPLSHILQNMGT